MCYRLACSATQTFLVDHLLGNLAHQMKDFLNPLDLSHLSGRNLIEIVCKGEATLGGRLGELGLLEYDKQIRSDLLPLL